MANFVLVAGIAQKALEYMLYIYYPIWLHNFKIKLLLNNNIKVNIMNLGYLINLGLKIYKIKVKAQKIDSSILETFGIVIVDFQVKNKAKKPRFFQETSLIANTKFKIILKMLFLNINNANISFIKKTLT